MFTSCKLSVAHAVMDLKLNVKKFKSASLFEILIAFDNVDIFKLILLQFKLIIVCI